MRLQQQSKLTNPSPLLRCHSLFEIDQLGDDMGKDMDWAFAMDGVGFVFGVPCTYPDGLLLQLPVNRLE